MTQFIMWNEPPNVNKWEYCWSFKLETYFIGLLDRQNAHLDTKFFILGISKAKILVTFWWNWWPFLKKHQLSAFYEWGTRLNIFKLPVVFLGLWEGQKQQKILRRKQRSTEKQGDISILNFLWWLVSISLFILERRNPLKGKTFVNNEHCCVVLRPRL